MKNNIYKKRLSRKEKEADDFEWYKYNIKNIIRHRNQNTLDYNGTSEYQRRKVNYDLYNNILDYSDLSYVCQPFGSEVGELPAKMVNRDISSNRIKALEGLESKRPFSFKVMAVNRDATTRREEEEFGRIKEFVVNEIMRPIRLEIELKYQQQNLNRELTEREKQEIQNKINEELQAQTPDRVRQYMQRDHQDPSEVLHHQLSEYLIKNQDMQRKFNKGWKHGLISAYSVFYVGIQSSKPVFKCCNPLRFDCDKSPDNDFIEEGEWASYEFRMTPSQVISMFDLTDEEIDRVYEDCSLYAEESFVENMFTYDEDYRDFQENTISVIHAVFKAPRKVGFLTYLDKNGEYQEIFVDETYRLNKDQGDISIEWDWIPEVYEGYQIGTDIYKGMQPIPGQFKDMDNLYNCKLPYHGVIFDDLNSKPTSVMDRMKVYQYYYNIVNYRLELLLASDKGKKILMNINAIPEDSGIDIEKWQYFFESTPFMWYNPDQEGTTYQDVNTIAKTLDLSLASDIGKYIELAEFLDRKCGKSVGITDAVIGDISPSSEVGNTKQEIVQTSNILEPYFELFNHVKRNCLQSLIDCAKVAYTENPPECLTYILDDMSLQTIKMDIGLLESSTVGVFVQSSYKSDDVKSMIQQFTHAALQNQKAELSDALSIIRQEGSQEAEEILRAAEEKRNLIEQQQQERQLKAASDESDKQREFEREKMQHEKDMLITEETLKTQREIQKQAILSVGFNENKDMDNDGKLDVLELAQNSINANIDSDIKRNKQTLEEKKFEHQKYVDNERLKLDKKKLEKS